MLALTVALLMVWAYLARKRVHGTTPEPHGRSGRTLNAGRGDWADLTGWVGDIKTWPG